MSKRARCCWVVLGQDVAPGLSESCWQNLGSRTSGWCWDVSDSSITAKLPRAAVAQAKVWCLQALLCPRRLLVQGSTWTQAAHKGMGHAWGVPSSAPASTCPVATGLVLGGAVLGHGYLVGPHGEHRLLSGCGEAHGPMGAEGTGLNLASREVVGKRHFGMASWRQLLELSSPVCAVAGGQLWSPVFLGICSS